MKAILLALVMILLSISVFATSYYDIQPSTSYGASYGYMPYENSYQGYSPYGGNYGSSSYTTYSPYSYNGYSDYAGPYAEQYKYASTSQDFFNFDRNSFSNDYSANRNYGNLNGYLNMNDVFDTRNMNAFESGRITKNNPCVSETVKIMPSGKSTHVKLYRQLCDGITYDFTRQNSLQDQTNTNQRADAFGLTSDAFNGNEANSNSGLQLNRNQYANSNEAEQFQTTFGRGTRIAF